MSNSDIANNVLRKIKEKISGKEDIDDTEDGIELEEVDIGIDQVSNDVVDEIEIPEHASIFLENVKDKLLDIFDEEKKEYWMGKIQMQFVELPKQINDYFDFEDNVLEISEYSINSLFWNMILYLEMLHDEVSDSNERFHGKVVNSYLHGLIEPEEAKNLLEKYKRSLFMSTSYEEEKEKALRFIYAAIDIDIEYDLGLDLEMRFEEKVKEWRNEGWDPLNERGLVLTWIEIDDD